MWEIADILKISKSVKLLVKMKNMSFLSCKKPHGLFGQPITLSGKSKFYEQKYSSGKDRMDGEEVLSRVRYQRELCRYGCWDGAHSRQREQQEIGASS